MFTEKGVIDYLMNKISYKAQIGVKKLTSFFKKDKKDDEKKDEEE